MVGAYKNGLLKSFHFILVVNGTAPKNKFFSSTTRIQRDMKTELCIW